MFIFLLAPYIELLGKNRHLQAALSGVMAAVVGVIANLAVFFGGNVLFSGGGLDAFALGLAAVSFVLLQRFKAPIYLMIPAGAIVRMAWTLL